ncbi:hypothetical protein ACLX1H_007530 [Fusarium chlamydosporum]
MNSDKRVQSRRTRTAVSTDPISGDGSVDETRSAPSLPRKEHSGDHNTVSKFVEAMNNPDWRRRREGYSSYDSMATTGSKTDYLAINSGGNHQPSTGNNAVTSHSNNKGPCPWNCIDNANHQRSSMDSSEAITRGRSVAPIDEDCPDTIIEEDINGLCALLENTEIINAPKDIRFLQLAPLSSKERPVQQSGKVIFEGQAYPVAHIQRVRGRLPRRKASEEDTESLSTGRNEENRARSNSSPHRSSEERYKVSRSSGGDSIERARKVVFEDPAVVNVGNRISESHTNAALPFVSSNASTKDDFSLRNEAFKKILKRLQQPRTDTGRITVSRRVKEETEQRNEAFKKLLKRLHHESGPDIRHASVNHTEMPSYPPGLSKKPYDVLHQHNYNSSDHGIVTAHISHPKKKEWSQDSGVCMDVDHTNQGLNPRAREFLSFKSFTGASGSSENTNGLGEDSLQRIYLDKGSEESECLINQPIGLGSTGSNHSLPFMSPGYINKSDKGSSDSEIGSIPVGGQGPAGIEPLSNMLPFPNVAFPFGACQVPTQSMASPGLLSSLGLGTSVGKWPPINSFGNQLSLPAANFPFQPFTVTPNPLLGVNATPQLPYNPPVVGGSYSACPPPVSKPTFPDASQQQQYEAYIEWRKANEPGYALACKNRQQRRAQRGLNPSHSTSEKDAHNEGQLV